MAAPDSDSINVGVNSSTRIQTRRTGVKGRRPSVDDLLQGELAYNYFDGTLSVKQDTAGVGVGTRVININNVPPGNTWFVATNGDDLNQGDSPDFPFLTIKKAAGIATPGDVIKIDGGTYIEDNPIVMQDFVTLAGADLRNTLIQPQNTADDLIWLGGGGTVQDVSFVGEVTDDAAVIAFRPLLGVSSDRYFDAARQIRQNLKYLRTEAVGFLTSGLSGFAGGNREQDAARLLDKNIDFIAEEAVGYLTSTDYLDPPFVISDSGGSPLSADNCSDDVKDLIRAISNDLKSNSNKKSIGAAQSYFTGGVLDHVDGVDSNGYSIADATIEAIERAVAISTDVINNRPYNSGLLIGNALNINSFDYTESTGVATVTTGVAHSLAANDIVKLVGLAFTCPPYNNTIEIYDFQYDASTGLSTVITKTAHGISTDQQVAFDGLKFECSKGFDSIFGITTASYDNVSGILTVTTDASHLLNDGMSLRLSDLEFSCSVEHAGVTTTIFPDGTNGRIFNTVIDATDATTFTTQVGTSTIPHVYEGSGTVETGITTDVFPSRNGTEFAISNFEYDKSTGLSTVTLKRDHNITAGETVNLTGIAFTCSTEHAGVTTTIFPDGTQGSEFEVISVGSSTLVINAGISTIGHTYDEGGFLYGVKYIGNYTVSSVGTSTDFTIPIETVGFAHTYVSGGVVKVGVTTNVFPVEDLNLSPRGLNYVVDSIVGPTTYVTNVGISSIGHNYIPDTGSSQKVKKYTALGQTISPSVLRVSEGCVAVGATIENLAGIVTNSIGTGVSYLTGITTVFGVDIDDIDKCALDVGTILLAVAHDITRGGNSKCIGAAKSYFNDDGSLIDTFLRRNEEIEQTIATLDHVFKPIRSVINNVGAGQFPIGTNVNVVAAEYNNDIGIVTITTNESHNLLVDDPVEIIGLGFTCLSDGGVTEVVFPSPRLGNIYDVYKVIDTTKFESVVGKSDFDHTYTSGGTVQKFGNFQEEFTQLRDLSIQGDPVFGWNRDLQGCANVVSSIDTCIGIVTGILQNYLDNVGLGTTAPEPWAGFTTTYPGNAGAGQTDPDAIPSQGVGIIRKGPYIINCTNFVKNSVGARIDGFASDEGDQENDLGIQGSFNVDSYTQFNQGGIGVSVSNGAYCQLVSIFTICCDTAISAVKGGQLDLTNSNSSFGTRGLVAIGVGDNTTSSADRYTARIRTSAARGDTDVVVTGVGTFKPYNGQALYFDQLYQTIEDVRVTDGGSGYTAPPKVIVEFPTGPGNAINAQATSSIDADGRVTSVNLLSQGLQYEYAPSITFVNQPGDTTGVGAAATALMTPVYYGVDSATVPYAGISTVTLVQTLNNDVGVGTTAYFSRQSLQIASSHSFEFIGAGNTIEFAYPSRGGVSRQEDEVIKIDGGEVIYTSTDERGNFRIGDGVVINQTTGTVSGRDYSKSLFVQVTPFILALGGD